MSTGSWAARGRGWVELVGWRAPSKKQTEVNQRMKESVRGNKVWSSCKRRRASRLTMKRGSIAGKMASSAWRSKRLIWCGATRLLPFWKTMQATRTILAKSSSLKIKTQITICTSGKWIGKLIWVKWINMINVWAGPSSFKKWASWALKPPKILSKMSSCSN